MSQCGKPIPKALWTYQPLYKTQTIPFEVSFKYPQHFGFIRKRLLQQNPSEPRGKKKRRKERLPTKQKTVLCQEKKVQVHWENEKLHCFTERQVRKTRQP